MNLYEDIREHVDLAATVRRFTDLASSGRTLKGRCPHPRHEDEDPSFVVYPDNRFRCYGCGWWGDVVDLWSGVKGLQPGKEAAMDLAREHDVPLPSTDPKAQAEARARRDLEARYANEAEEAHERLVGRPDVTGWWEDRGFDEELRRRFLLGTNASGSEAVIPFWNRGRVHGLIRRKLRGEPRYVLPTVEEFPRGHRPLFLPGSARDGVVLAEGYTDALALTALGFDAAAVGGTYASQHQLDELWSLPGPIYALPDDDKEGRKAGYRWVKELYPKVLLCPPIRTAYEKEDASD